MATFQYKAHREDQTAVEGRIEADNLESARLSLEEQGFVTSHWDTGSGGPARRLYRITEEGDGYLAWWVEDLRETDRVLHRFLETYDSHMKEHA